RVAQAHERGLSAALVDGPAADAAAASGGPPPAVRLEPPAGLATVVAAVVLAVGALSIPAGEHRGDVGAAASAEASPPRAGGAGVAFVPAVRREVVAAYFAARLASGGPSSSPTPSSPPSTPSRTK